MKIVLYEHRPRKYVIIVPDERSLRHAGSRTDRVASQHILNPIEGPFVMTDLLQDFYRRVARVIATTPHTPEIIASTFGFTTGELLDLFKDEQFLAELSGAAAELVTFVEGKTGVAIEGVDAGDRWIKAKAQWHKLPKWDRDPAGWLLP